MTGPEHYRIAQDLVLAMTTPSGPRHVRILREHISPEVLAVAQVHATLALAAATALHPGLFDDWYDVAGPPAGATS